MATATEVINRLAARGVTFQAEDAGRLRVNGISRLTDGEKAALRAHKAAILQALAATVATVATVQPKSQPATGVAGVADVAALPIENSKFSAVAEAFPNRAETNRQAMPHIADVVDQFRRVFGADQVKVVLAEENGVRLGRQEAEPKAGTAGGIAGGIAGTAGGTAGGIAGTAGGTAGTCYHCRHWCGTKSGNGYCVVGFAPPIRRQADDTCAHFTKEGA